MNHRVFLLHAATALEHLAKAVLAARHASLIVATNDFESLLHACGESGFARGSRTRSGISALSPTALMPRCRARARAVPGGIDVRRQLIGIVTGSTIRGGADGGLSHHRDGSDARPV